jgi:hypothetical protein
MSDEENAASRMLRTAIRMGDSMSGQIADHSLKLRRAKRAIESALRLLKRGQAHAACNTLETALALWECDNISEDMRDVRESDE